MSILENPKFKRLFLTSKETEFSTSVFDQQLLFYLGNCYLRLEDYSKCKQYYSKSISAMIEYGKLWKDIGHLDWLVDIVILAGRADLYRKVSQEIQSCESTIIGTYPVFDYAMCIMDGVMNNHLDSSRIQKLLNNPKNIEVFQLGEALQAILVRNNEDFNIAINKILLKHEGQAKRGGLRETAEGFICMNAMALGYLGLQNGFSIKAQSEYFCVEYLNYLIDRN